MKINENTNWFNLNIKGDGDRTVATYTDRNGKQKVSVYRHNDDEYDPKVAVDYLMQKLDFNGAKADDDWHCGDIVAYNGEKAEIVATNECSVILDFKFELGFAYSANNLFFTYYDKDGKVWRANNEKKTYLAVAKDDKDLELVKAVRKMGENVKPNPNDYPFKIGDRIFSQYLLDYGTVVAYVKTNRNMVLARMDNKSVLCHKGLRYENCMIDACGNPFKADKSEYWWVHKSNAVKVDTDFKLHYRLANNLIPDTLIDELIESNDNLKLNYGGTH